MAFDAFCLDFCIKYREDQEKNASKVMEFTPFGFYFRMAIDKKHLEVCVQGSIRRL